MENINVLHIASFNGNIGDNANHNGLRNILGEICYPKKLKYHQLEMREFYKSWSLRDFNDKNFIDLCNNHDLVIIGGGNFFELKWDYSYTGTTINIDDSTLQKINSPILFYGLGCDIGKGTNQDNVNKFDKFLEKLTSSSKYLVTIRNDGSEKNINKLYGNKYSNKVYKVYDGAFFLETSSFNYPELIDGYRAIGINVVSDLKSIRFNKDITYNEFINRFSNVLNDFLGKHNNYQLIFFPHIYSDLAAINDVLENIDDIYRRTRIVIAPTLSGNGSEKYIFGLYKKCDLILGMRFHSNVCAIAQNVPTIGLSSYLKIDDLYEELKLIDRVIKVNEMGFEKVILRKISETLNDLAQIELRYKVINEAIQEKNLKIMNLLKRWLSENKLL